MFLNPADSRRFGGGVGDEPVHLRHTHDLRVTELLAFEDFDEVLHVDGLVPKGDLTNEWFFGAGKAKEVEMENEARLEDFGKDRTLEGLHEELHIPF
jgi:hypothetical protein